MKTTKAFLLGITLSALSMSLLFTSSFKNNKTTAYSTSTIVSSGDDWILFRVVDNGSIIYICQTKNGRNVNSVSISTKY